MYSKLYKIKDPIYGLVFFDEIAKQIIDSEEFQRLRRINQLGSASFVYPGGTHTRFEHSIGVMHLGYRFSKDIAYSALVHDIGHVAFSHDGEYVVKKIWKKDHEQIGKEILKTLKEKIPDMPNVDIEHPIISFEFGIDRLDYLKRDAYHTGTSYGMVETDIILNNIVYENKICYIKEKALKSAEAMLVGRFMMIANVYYHKTNLAVSSMIRTMIEQGIENQIIFYEDLFLGDDILLWKLRDLEIAKKLLTRKLYKKLAVVEEIDIDELHKYGFLTYEAESKNKYEGLVMTEEGLKPIYQISAIARSLMKEAKDIQGIYIFYDPLKMSNETAKEMLNKLLKK